MFWSLLVGIAMGLALKFVSEPISGLVRSKIELSEQESGILSFTALMLVGSLISAILSDNASAFWLIIGGLLGVFGYRIIDAAKAKADAARSSAAEKVEDAKDAAEDVIEAKAEVVEDAVDAAKDAVSK